MSDCKGNGPTEHGSSSWGAEAASIGNVWGVAVRFTSTCEQSACEGGTLCACATSHLQGRGNKDGRRGLIRKTCSSAMLK